MRPGILRMVAVDVVVLVVDGGDLDATDVDASADDRAVPTPKAHVIVRVDHQALLRGHVEGDETCEIEGVGPVPVSDVEQVMGDAFLQRVDGGRQRLRLRDARRSAGIFASLSHPPFACRKKSAPGATLRSTCVRSSPQGGKAGGAAVAAVRPPSAHSSAARSIMSRPRGVPRRTLALAAGAVSCNTRGVGFRTSKQTG